MIILEKEEGLRKENEEEKDQLPHLNFSHVILQNKCICI